jgi:hypothetical protein
MDTETINKALQPLRTEYYQQIRAIATEVAKLPEDEQQDALAEMLGNHEFVIHTYKARLVSLLSDNHDAYTEYFEERADNSAPEPKAYFAMQADVNELLNNAYFQADMTEGV